MLEVVGQHIVYIAEQRHFVLGDDAQDTLYPFVVLLADVHGLTDTGRDVHFLVKGGNSCSLSFDRLRRVGISSVFCSSSLPASFPIGASSSDSSCFSLSTPFVLASGGMLMSSRRNELMMKLLSMSSTLVFFAIVFIF